jgi:hypothetical protein
MRPLAVFRVRSGFVCIVAAAGMAAAPAGIAAPPAGPALAPRAHGFMLYLSQPIGAGGAGSTHPRFGFRIEQLRMTGNSGAPDGGDPLQHRALVGWQMDGLRGIHASDMKVELGGRVTYDVTHGAFGVQMPRTSAASGSRPAASTRTDASRESRPFSPHLFEPGPATRDAFRQTGESVSMAHDIAAAAIDTFRLSRPVPAQQRTGTGPRPSSMRDGG